MRRAWVVFSLLSLALGGVYLLGFYRAGDATDPAFLFVTLMLLLGILLMEVVVRLWRRRGLPVWVRTLLAAAIAYHACFGIALAVAGMTDAPTRTLARLYPHVVHGFDALE